MDNVRKMRLYSVDSMQEAERRAGSEYGISLTTLMDRAGKGLAKVAREMIGSSPSLVAIFCGTGNNGGDGYVCAQELLNDGVPVTVYASGSPHPGGLAFDAADSFRRAGGFVVPADGLATVPADAALLVDCLLGTGLARPVTGLYASLIALINEADVPVLSCDVPSGVNADDGAVMGAAVQAERTVVMGLAKPACELRPGCECFGEIEVCDIGFPPELVASLSQWVSGR